MAGRRTRTRNLWPRRIITTSGLLLILTGLVFGVTRLVPVVRDFFASRAEAVQAPASTPVRIDACRESDLRVELSADPDRVSVGVGTVLAYRVAARTPCRTAAGALGVLITSGSQTVWDSTACASHPSATPLLVDASATWSGSVRWDGQSRQGCSGRTSPARAGTYRAVLLVGGRRTGTPVVFEVGG